MKNELNDPVSPRNDIVVPNFFYFSLTSYSRMPQFSKLGKLGACNKFSDHRNLKLETSRLHFKLFCDSENPNIDVSIVFF